ncbi:hypothetical protein BJX64DRAFT_284824 [Aspergillus heterothallicus]
MPSAAGLLFRLHLLHVGNRPTLGFDEISYLQNDLFNLRQAWAQDAGITPKDRAIADFVSTVTPKMNSMRQQFRYIRPSKKKSVMMPSPAQLFFALHLRHVATRPTLGFEATSFLLADLDHLRRVWLAYCRGASTGFISPKFARDGWLEPYILHLQPLFAWV